MISIDWDSATPADKTGRSAAIRCRACGQVTIADEYAVGEPGQAYIYEDRVETSHFLVCRLCASQCLPAERQRLVTWEQFDLALASDELVERTAPKARDSDVESDDWIRPRKCDDDVPRPALALLHSFEKYPANTDFFGGVVMIMTVLLGIGLWFTLTSGMGNSVLFAAKICVGWLALGAFIAYRLHLHRRDAYVAGVLMPFARRFLTETDADYTHLLGYAQQVRGYPRALGVVKCLKTALADIPAVEQEDPPLRLTGAAPPPPTTKADSAPPKADADADAPDEAEAEAVVKNQDVAPPETDGDPDSLLDPPPQAPPSRDNMRKPLTN